MAPTQRKSNIELMRVVAMSSVMLHHFLHHVLLKSVSGTTTVLAAEAFFMWGVNLFFLISGYLSIKFSWKAVIGLVLTMMFFNLANYGMLLGVGLYPSIDTLVRIFLFPIESGRYWFMQTYMAMLFTMPVLTVGLRSLDRRSLRFVAVGVTVLMIYSGGLGGSAAFQGGYGYLLGVCCYVWGFYIRTDGKWLARISSWRVGGAVVATGLLAIACTLLIKYYPHIAKAIHPSATTAVKGHTTVFVVVMSTGIFELLRRLDFTSRFINAAGYASLGCYLLQDGMFGRYWYYAKQISWIKASGTWAALGILIGSYIVFWLAAYLLMRVKDAICRPLTDRLIGWMPRWMQPDIVVGRSAPRQG